MSELWNLVKRWWSAKFPPRCSTNPFFGVYHRAYKLIELTNGRMWAKFYCRYCRQTFIRSKVEVAMMDLDLFLEMEGIKWESVTPQPAPKSDDAPAPPAQGLGGTSLASASGHLVEGSGLSRTMGLAHVDSTRQAQLSHTPSM